MTRDDNITWKDNDMTQPTQARHGTREGPDMTDTNALRERASYRSVGSNVCVVSASELIAAADELDRLRAELSEERHAHNKTQFDLAQVKGAASSMWDILVYVSCASDCEASRKAAAAVIAEVDGVLHPGEHRSKSDD